MDGSNRASHRLRFDRSWIAPLHVGDLTSFGSESGPPVGTFSGRNLESFVDFQIDVDVAECIPGADLHHSEWSGVSSDDF